MAEKETKRPIRVVLADDHKVVRVGIRRILSRTDDIEVIGEAANGLDAIHLVRQLEPDILLLDIEMPGLTGLMVARRLRELACPVRIVVLSGYDDREYIQGMLDENVVGYIVKGEPPDSILSAVRMVASGYVGWYSQKVTTSIQNIDRGATAY